MKDANAIDFAIIPRRVCGNLFKTNRQKADGLGLRKDF